MEPDTGRPRMPKIPLIDLRAQYRSIKTEIDAAIQRVLDSGQRIVGPLEWPHIGREFC